MLCQICFENDLTHNITCSYCQYIVCKTCISTYLTIEPKEPSCLYCKKVWSREFVMESYNDDKKWIKNGFLPNLARLIQEKEKMLLPDTQDEANLVRKIRELSVEIQSLPYNDRIEKKYKTKPEILEVKLNEKRQLRNTLLSQMYTLKMSTITYGNKKDIEKKIVKYIMKCPYDGCRGFVNNEYICGSCENNVCSACYCCQEVNHNCKKEDIESAKLIRSETKQFPKCLAHIFKSGGCHQMFCTY